MKNPMPNGDYRHLFPLGKLYKSTINHWFYHIAAGRKCEQRPDTIFMLIETNLYYYSTTVFQENCQTDAKVLMENGDLMMVYAIKPNTILLVEG